MSASCLVFVAGVTMAAGGGWRDGFDGPRLDARWRQVVSVAGPTFGLTERKGWLRLAVPAHKDGFSHWVNEQKSPLLLADAPKGDFVYEGRVEVSQWSPGGNLHLALVVAFSEGYVLAWGPFYSKMFGGGHKTPEIWAELTGIGGYLKVPGDGRKAYLRIVKTGCRYAMAMKRKADEAYKTIGTIDVVFPPRYVGLMGKTFGGAPAAAADVDYLR